MRFESTECVNAPDPTGEVKSDAFPQKERERECEGKERTKERGRVEGG